jgi:hypothetical protein
MLSSAAAETLMRIAADPRHLGARIGFLAVLHTGDKTFIMTPTSTASSQAAESLTVSAAVWRAVSSHDGSVESTRSELAKCGSRGLMSHRVSTVFPCVWPSLIARKASFARSIGRTCPTSGFILVLTMKLIMDRISLSVPMIDPHTVI